jgi:tRNA A-37 threonylcarbamoyl transferase component Bud32
MFAKLFLTAVAGKTGTLVGTKSPEALQKELIVKLSQYFMQYAAGTMKGPIHKFAQIVLNIFTLPAEAEANFKSVLWSKQVLPEKTMRKVLEEDLGKKVEDVFAEFDFAPIGVGSVSQVYRARLHTGEEVAVKVQYPDLEKITKQDMAMFSRIFTGARWLFPKLDVAAIKALVQNLVDREIDFRDEARVCLELGKIAARGARWSIPKVYPELTTRKVLTTEYISGLNLYQFRETASVEERTSAAMAVAEFGLRSVTDAGLMCVDPHPANLIFSEGKVYLIDFGFFMKVPATFVNLHRSLTVIHGVGGEELVDRYYQTLREVGLLNPSPQVPETDIREFLHVMVRQFNWGSCGDPTLQDQFNELFFKRGINRVFGSPTPEFFLSYLGKCQVFKTINRLGVAQPQEWSQTLAEEMRQRQGAPAETAASAPTPATPIASAPAPRRKLTLKTAPLGAA